MSGFDVFGTRRGASGAQDGLDATAPTEAARRKLTDASQGLGSGIVADPLRTLHEHHDHLDRPLLAELADRTAAALAAGAFKRRNELYAQTADALGAWPALADQIIVNQVESTDGNQGFCAHILPGGGSAHPFELDGETVCGKDAANGYVRLQRGAWRESRVGRGIRVGNQGLQWCKACAAHEDEYDDTRDGIPYPVLGTAATEALLAELENALRAELTERVSSEISQAEGFAWADARADELFLARIAAAGHMRGANAVIYALRRDAAEQLAEMLAAHHGVELTEALPDEKGWQTITETAFADLSAHPHMLTVALKPLLEHITGAAATRSGKPPLPEGFSLIGDDAETAPTPQSSDQERRAAIRSSRGRI